LPKLNLQSNDRLLAGYCPQSPCGRLIVVVNSGEGWPLLKCSGCGWRGRVNGDLVQEHLFSSSVAGGVRILDGN